MIWPRLAARTVSISSARDVAAGLRDLLQTRERLRGFRLIPSLEGTQRLDLPVLLFGCGTAERDLFEVLPRRGIRVQKGIDSDDGQLSTVFLELVEEGFLLDPAPLILKLHGSQHAPALVEAVEFCQHCRFHQVGQLREKIGALQRVLCLSSFRTPRSMIS